MEFVARCAGKGEIAGLIDEFQDLIRDFGLDCCAGGCWAGVGRERQYRFFFNNWPPEWRAYYAAQDYFPRDFIVAELRVRMRPFLWNEMDSAVFSVPGAKEFFDATRAHGWIDGFVDPDPRPGRFRGHRQPRRQAKHQTRSDRSRRVGDDGADPARALRLAVGFGAEPAAVLALSAREIECVQWAAAGKTDWEIGRLLGVTGATAHFHIEQVKKKLKVRSRVQAVAILTLHGVI